MKVRYDYVVKVVIGVKEEQEERFVTGIDGKFAEWEKGKEALKMSKQRAEDLVLGLTLNFIPAMVVQTIKDVFKFAND